MEITLSKTMKLMARSLNMKYVLLDTIRFLHKVVFVEQTECFRK